jgi:uncharacterized protein YjbI with pentapeptide repeats
VSECPRDPLDRRRILIIGCVAVLAILAVGYLIFWVLPGALAPDQSAGFGPKSEAKAHSDVRTAALQFFGGCVLAVGAVFTAWSVYLTRKRDREQRRTDDKRIEVDREGQITDRFSNAVEQLGHKSVDVRLGGIYALERIARDSPERDHRTTMEVLVAFVQVHAPKDSPKQKSDTEDPRDRDRARPDADVMGALTVLGRRKCEYDQGLRLNLPRTDLRGVRLRYDDARFKDAVLRYANLRGAHLEGAHLEGAELREVILEGADLADAHLNDASLPKAKLKGANLEGANLSGACLRKAELSPYRLPNGKSFPTVLENADLSGAHLEGANLSEARLRGANLHGAHADADTVWSDGLNTVEARRRRGVLGPE